MGLGRQLGQYNWAGPPLAGVTSWEASIRSGVRLGCGVTWEQGWAACLGFAYGQVETKLGVSVLGMGMFKNWARSHAQGHTGLSRLLSLPHPPPTHKN